MAWPWKEMQKNVLNDLDPETSIYRIFSRQRFLELVISRKNTLVNPSMWDDPFENAFLQCTAVMENGEEASLERIRDKWYGQCWTTDKDTDAMWRIYSQNKDGVRVKTTVKKIFSQLWHQHQYEDAKVSCFIGKVFYEKREEIEKTISTSFVQNLIANEMSTANTLLLKRTEFSHENEIRILFQDIHHREIGKLYQHKIDLTDTLEEVTIDPRATPEDAQVLATFLRSQGLEIPFNQSTLYSFTPQKIKFAPDGQQLPITQMP